MPEIPRKNLDQLRGSADKLNQITDKAADAVREVENFLADCNWGSAVIVPAGQDEDGLAICLEYRRIGQKFRVAITWPDIVGESPTPWSDCHRAIKLQTITALPKLLAAIKSEIDSQLKLAIDAEIAIKKIREMLSAMKEGA